MRQKGNGMKRKTSAAIALIFFPVFCSSICVQGQSSNPQQTLNQYVADLQGNPNDTALRGKIIALAQSMNPPPETPAEARRHMARGVGAVEDAKTPGDFKDACNEFLQAATLAPWLANAYRNLAIAQDKAGMYNESLASLRFYLLTKPSSADADWADDLKSKVEYRKEKAAKAKEEENSPQAVTRPRQDSFEDLLRKIDGRRYTLPTGVMTRVIDIKGKVLVLGILHPVDYRADYRYEILGRETTIQPSWDQSGVRPQVEAITYIISEDGGSITQRLHYSDGDQRDHIYLWQR